MTSSTLLWSVVAVAVCVIGGATTDAWYVNDDPTAVGGGGGSDYGSESIGGGNNPGGALLDDDVINSDDVMKRLIGDEMTDGGDMTCKRKMVSVFGQLLISEYNRKSGGGFVISSDISNRCKDEMCVLSFSVSPTQCIPSNTDPTYCDVIIVSEGQRRCHASVDMGDGVVRSPLSCQLSEDDDVNSQQRQQFAKLLASVVKRPIKRWGQMHGHVHPF